MRRLVTMAVRAEDDHAFRASLACYGASIVGTVPMRSGIRYKLSVPKRSLKRFMRALRRLGESEA